jgi:hypothetical protein
VFIHFVLRVPRAILAVHLAVMTPFSLAVAVSLCGLNLVSAISKITFYSDNQCTTVIGVTSGLDNGTCTQFPTDVLSFGSFEVTSLDQTCAGMFCQDKALLFQA